MASLYRNYHRFDNAQEAEEAFRAEEVAVNPHATFFEWVRREVEPQFIEQIKHRPMQMAFRNCNREFNSEDEVFAAYQKEELSKSESQRRWITDWYFSEIDFEEDVSEEADDNE